MTTKSNTYAVHAQPAPSPGHTTGEAVGWTIASLFIITIPLLLLALAVAVIRFIWKRSAVAVLLIALPLFGQSKVETAANFTLRAFDAAQSCYYLTQVPRARETWLPTKTCAGVAIYSAGVATGSFALDRLLIKHGHSRWARFQIVSAGGAGIAVGYDLIHWH